VVQGGMEKLGDAKGVVLIEDESGEIARKLNAFFLPRAYGFVDGKLVWLQRQPDLGLTGTLMDFLKLPKSSERGREGESHFKCLVGGDEGEGMGKPSSLKG